MWADIGQNCYPLIPQENCSHGPTINKPGLPSSACSHIPINLLPLAYRVRWGAGGWRVPLGPLCRLGEGIEPPGTHGQQPARPSLAVPSCPLCTPQGITYKPPPNIQDPLGEAQESTTGARARARARGLRYMAPQPGAGAGLGDRMLGFCLPPEHQPYRHRKLWGVQKPNRKWLRPQLPSSFFPPYPGPEVWGVARDLWVGGSSLGKGQGID